MPTASSKAMRFKKTRTQNLPLEVASQHRSTKWLAICGASLGAAIALLTHAPAAWLASAVYAASHGRVQLLQAHGSLWNGSAAIVLAAAAGGSAAMTWPSRWEWRLRPEGLGLGVQLQSMCCTPVPIRLRASLSGLEVRPGDLQMPMAVLQGLGTPWNTVEMQGNLHFRWQKLEMFWQQTLLLWQGAVQLKAMRISTRLSTLPEIGSYQIDIQGGEQPVAQVSTLQGPLHLEGSGHMQRGKWRFEGQAYAQPEQADALANLLNLLGQRSADKTKIQWGYQ